MSKVIFSGVQITRRNQHLMDIRVVRGKHPLGEPNTLELIGFTRRPITVNSRLAEEIHWEPLSSGKTLPNPTKERYDFIKKVAALVKHPNIPVEVQDRFCTQLSKFQRSQYSPPMRPRVWNGFNEVDIAPEAIVDPTNVFRDESYELWRPSKD